MSPVFVPRARDFEGNRWHKGAGRCIKSCLALPDPLAPRQWWDASKSDRKRLSLVVANRRACRLASYCTAQCHGLRKTPRASSYCCRNCAWAAIAASTRSRTCWRSPSPARPLGSVHSHSPGVHDVRRRFRRQKMRRRNGQRRYRPQPRPER